MKKFFCACAAILCLTLAYHFGATNAQGQAGSPVMGVTVAAYASGPQLFVLTQSGDCYVRTMNTGPWSFNGSLIYVGTTGAVPRPRNPPRSAR